MPTFEDLYEQVAKSTLAGESDEQIRAKTLHFDRQALACLLHPEKYAPVWRTGDCDCSSDKAGCAAKCPFGAMEIDDDGNVAVNADRCVGCTECVSACPSRCLDIRFGYGTGALRLPAWGIAAGTLLILLIGYAAAVFTGHWEADLHPQMIRMFLN